MTDTPRTALRHCMVVHANYPVGEARDARSTVRSRSLTALRRRCNAGVEVTVAQDHADLRAIYYQHVRVRKYKYGLPAQPYDFIRRIWDTFGERDHGALLLATIDDRDVAGVMFLEWQDGLFYVPAAPLRAVLLLLCATGSQRCASG